MPFSAAIDANSIFPVIRLKNEDNSCEAEVYAFGALLNGFSIATAANKKNVIDGFASPQDAVENITNGFKSAKLSPFVCRMKNGEYVHQGTAHKIKKYFLGDSAIHGLLYDATFTIKDSGADDGKAYVTLAYKYNKKEEGFPFAFSMEVSYMLSEENKLAVITKVTNTGVGEMPLSDGWHPYFCLGETVNDLKVEFNSKEMIEFTDELIPSGNKIPYNTFSSFKTFGDTFLDNCFVLEQTKEVACSIKDETSGLQLDIIPDASYPYLQIYTPPHRKSIAIENLSSVPDAFNNGMGLIMAKPGEAYTFATAYQLKTL